MANKIHFFTSGKGGVGKTLQALCASLYYLTETGGPLLICDFNFLNPDLYQILSQLRDEDASPVHTAGFSVIEITKYNALTKLVVPNNQYRIPNDIPYGFLKNVCNAIEIDKSFSPRVVIVDTGLHIANLGLEAENRDISPASLKTELQRSLFDRFDPFIWFTWTIAALTRQQELDGVTTAINTLENIGKSNGEHWFKDTQNLIHVINPHALMSDISLMKLIYQSFSRGFDPNIQTIGALEQISDLPPIGDISFKFVRENISKSVMRTGEPRSVVDESTQYEHLEKIVQPIVAHKNGRPNNLFPIPYFMQRLIGYTDSMALNSLNDVDKFKPVLGGVYRVIEKYLSELEARA